MLRPTGNTNISSSAVVAFHSRGKFVTEANAEALQGLVDDLTQQGGGTVWVCRSMTLEHTLQLKSGVQLDFLGHSVRLGDGSLITSTDQVTEIPRVSLAQLNNVSRAGVQNVYVLPLKFDDADLAAIGLSAATCSENQRDPIVQFVPTSGDVVDCFLNRVLVEAPQVKISTNAGGSVGDHPTAPDHCYNGVILDASSQSSIRRNYIGDFFLVGSCNGMLLREGGGSEIEGNFVTNLAAFLCQAMITFVPLPQQPSPRGFVANTFDIIRGQSDYSLTHAAVRGVSGTGNHFDHTFLWDFWYAYGCCPSAPPYQLKYGDFGVNPSAKYTYINSESINGILNCAGFPGATSTTRVVEFNHPECLWTAQSVSTHITCSCSVEPLCLSTCCGSYPPSSVFPTAVSTAGDHLTYCYCTTCGGATGYTVQGSCASTRSGAGAWSPGGARPNDGPPEGLPERPRSGVPSDFRILGWRDVAAGLR